MITIVWSSQFTLTKSRKTNGTSVSGICCSGLSRGDTINDTATISHRRVEREREGRDICVWREKEKRKGKIHVSRSITIKIVTFRRRVRRCIRL